MHHAARAVVVAVVAIAFLAPVSASAQNAASVQTPVRSDADGAGEWTLPRTPDGRPDLQGYWTTQTFTPLERPVYLGDREFFTEEEAAWLRRELTAEGVDPSAREILNLIDIEDRAEIQRYKYQGNRTRDERHHIHYDNEIWLRTPVPKGLSSRRTSLITYPRNGRIPPLTPEAAARAASTRAAQAHPSAFDSHETRPLSERCIVWSHEGPPMMPPSYNDIHQIFQTPDHVVVFSELATNPPRIIPLDGRPHVADAIRQFPGDSRGRWEGGHAGRRDPQLRRAETLPGSRRRAARRGALHPQRPRSDSLRVHGHRPGDVDQPVERGASDGEDHRSAVRVRVPRGESRHSPHPGDSPQPRTAGGGPKIVDAGQSAGRGWTRERSGFAGVWK